MGKLAIGSLVACLSGLTPGWDNEWAARDGGDLDCETIPGDDQRLSVSALLLSGPTGAFASIGLYCGGKLVAGCVDYDVDEEPCESFAAAPASGPLMCRIRDPLLSGSRTTGTFACGAMDEARPNIRVSSVVTDDHSEVAFIDQNDCRPMKASKVLTGEFESIGRPDGDQDSPNYSQIRLGQVNWTCRFSLQSG